MGLKSGEVTAEKDTHINEIFNFRHALNVDTVAVQCFRVFQKGTWWQLSDRNICCLTLIRYYVSSLEFTYREQGGIE